MITSNNASLIKATRRLAVVWEMQAVQAKPNTSLFEGRDCLQVVCFDGLLSGLGVALLFGVGLDLDSGGLTTVGADSGTGVAVTGMSFGLELFANVKFISLTSPLEVL